MKKLFYSLFILATTAMTLTSCEDVPAPFDIPTDSNDKPTEVVDPTGSGTVADPYNVAAAIAYAQQLESGEKSPSNIYIKGKIASIREEFTSQYGNGTFSISDDGSEKNTFLIYRAKFLGNKNWTENDKQIQVGDEVVICGIVTNYNGTLETDQNKAYIYSLNGEGGGSDTPGGETGTPKGSGTLEDPWNPVAANQFVSSLASDQETDKDYYIKGKISKIANNGEFSAQYGNASFYITEDGNEGSDFYVFRTYYLGNKQWKNGDTQIKVGDEVIICGRLVNYKGNTPETVQNKSYIYSLNGKSEGGDTPQPSGDAKGSGTLEDPWNAVAANNYTSGLAADKPSDKVFYIKGKIASVKESFSSQFGNASFYISDDGNDNNTFYVFRTLYLGNKKWEEGNTQIKVGDEVIICGKVVNYKGNTPETQQNESYIYSLNGKTSDDGSGDDPKQSDMGTYEKPYDVPSAIAAGTVNGVYVKAYIVGYVNGQAYEEDARFTADGCEVLTNLLIAASKSETKASNCMPVQLPAGDVRTGLNLKDNPGNLGQEVLLYGNIDTYFRVPGVKSVTYAEIGGKSIGKKP